MEQRIKMVDVDHCLICGEHIGLGNDPAVCDDEDCLYLLEAEVNHDKGIREEMENGLFKENNQQVK